MGDAKLTHDLREWARDALLRHQYDTAVYVGDKLLAISDDDNDAFWLANAHFQAGRFHHCQALLARRRIADATPQSRCLNAHAALKLGHTDEALRLLGETNPAHLVSVPAHGSARQKLRHVDNHTHPRRHTKAVARTDRTDRMPTSEERDREDADTLKAEAAMCYLRGLCYARLNSFDRAKDCYRTAVQIDVTCMDAFNALVDNSLLSPDEEWVFLESLNFDSLAASPGASPEMPDLIRNLYITRLSKYARTKDFTDASETLSTHYNLASNPDLLRAKADLLFKQCRFQDALALTSSVLAIDRFNFAVVPLHFAVMAELHMNTAIYLFSHELADAHPDEPATWVAVGTHYLVINKVAEARRFFSKSSQMDQYYGPAWIGFGHTFAEEGEHDQAISAYSTAARLFQGSHLPQLFLGMQHLQLGSLSVAREYLNTAYTLCQTDPLVLNEMGAVAYNTSDLVSAIEFFRRALDHAAENQSDPSQAMVFRINLAMSLRRHGAYDEALHMYDAVLRGGVKDAGWLTSKALTLMGVDRNWEAVTVLHEALALAPQDPIATDLLNRALEANEVDERMRLSDEPLGAHANLIEDEIEDDGFEEALRRRKQEALRDVEPNRVAGRRRRGRRHAAGFVEEESMVVDSDG